MSPIDGVTMGDKRSTYYGIRKVLECTNKISYLRKEVKSKFTN